MDYLVKLLKLQEQNHLDLSPEQMMDIADHAKEDAALHGMDIEEAIAHQLENIPGLEHADLEALIVQIKNLI